MKTNRLRNYSAGILWQKYISLLLVAFVFVLGMLGGGTADAAKITADDVSRTVTIQPRAKKGEEKPSKTVQIKMHVMLENLDLKAYEKYTAELRKNAKYGNVVFAKAAPGSKVTITADAAPIPGILSKPARDYNYSVGIKYYNHKKIGTLKELTSLGKEDGFVRNYTIPNDVEEVTAYVSVTYHNIGMEAGKEMKTSTGTYRKEPALARHYYIFTSDAACKKAYDLMKGDSATGSTASSLGAKTNSNAKSDSKQSDGKSGGKDSGGLGTVAKVIIGVVVVGAVGYGAYRMFGKGGGSKGNGAGNYNNPAGGPQPMQRPSAPMPNSYGPQPKQRPGAATRNASGQRSTQRPGAAKRSAAENVTYCKQCGAPMRSGSHFCKNCGARNTSDICPNCGAKLEPDDMFCGNCGMKV